MASKKQMARSPGLRSFKQTYGTVLGEINPVTGKRAVINPRAAAQALTDAMGYVPGGTPGTSTPIGPGPENRRYGYVNNATARFSFAGSKPKAGRKTSPSKRSAATTSAPKRRKKARKITPL